MKLELPCFPHPKDSGEFACKNQTSPPKNYSPMFIYKPLYKPAKGPKPLFPHSFLRISLTNCKISSKLACL